MSQQPERTARSQAFVDAVTQAPVMAILRGPDGEALVAPALRLLDAGIDLLEISLTTPGACRAIEQVVARADAGRLVGAGTVLTAGDVADVEAAGAQFVVTPALAESVAECVRRDLPVAAGALTPSEVLAAHLQGAAAVKVFPASLGGPAYLKALRDPFPGIALMAVGGVDVAATTAFLRAGAIGVGVGSPLLGDAAAGGDLDALARRARAYLDAAGEARP
ncbi:bifunctional 4-hydroxy-2-oxoglutarate aldolase/2-dehydro-3-deoxy-phosphogluconate aldolase [Angustibacter sp. Root456]|uniref:bifunctional 4-hydroxy-2-oxoglutarate aldolase/2-dehydro-3-deoxy-phosphogluconate aldolase n=1 Tax=Angustibacter sp. Root456 TaxID=1736539 RepID=UPI0006F9F035|nr:bifunctional 4-hydroxy-2-oxoglutarate aldolase/2-dehydro-3-deoxy-phosphogluconate aldolase [Angustibacter sp. Root456]KQX68611.1 aldolase [Angustibacter sp. Root456]